jgi:mannose-6-phosphate isomerase-like protein (cupin superfamily)
MLNPSRRTLLKTASLATAALAARNSSALSAIAQTPAATPEPFKLVSASQLGEAIHKTQAKPGNETLVDTPSLPFTIVVTTETKKAAPVFEMHEGRDHIFQVLEGTTVYDLGGKLQDAKNIRPSEWTAPTSEGSTTITLNKGDMLTVSRGTPHRRRTETSVTFTLISTEGKRG